MFQFPGFARTGLCIHPAVTPSPCGVTLGFPIRTSPDQGLFDGSPELIAAYHVLHRLSTPRHPPRTLTSLIAWLTRCPPLRSPWRFSDTPQCRRLSTATPAHPTRYNRTRGSVATELARSALVERTGNVHPLFGCQRSRRLFKSSGAAKENPAVLFRGSAALSDAPVLRARPTTIPEALAAVQPPGRRFFSGPAPAPPAQTLEPSGLEPPTSWLQTRRSPS